MNIKLWQTLQKKDVDVFDELSDDQWQEFVRQNERAFAEQCSQTGQDLFNQFKCEKDI
jgi:hypothetical protein